MNPAAAMLEARPDWAAAALEMFGLSPGLALNRLEGEAWLLEDSGRRLVLKLHQPWSFPNRDALEAIYALCAEAGAGPRMLPDRQGRLLPNLGGRAVSLQPFCPGRRPGPEDAPAAASSLARLHQALSKASFPDLRNHLEREVGGVGHAASGLVAGEVLAGLEAAERFLAREPRQILHGDLHPGNQVLSAGRLLFLDLDSATWGSPAQDLAFAAFRLSGGDQKVFNGYVGVYNQAAERPISKDPLPLVVIRQVVERLAYIIFRAREGDRSMLGDLDNQYSYLASATAMARAEGAL